MNNPAQQQKKPMTAITPTRAEDFPEWYQSVVRAADMAENSPVRGSMIIKPYGFALWENMTAIFDKWLKDYGIQNCSFPLLIPVSFLSKEAEHVDGFAKECAVVTHHRLEKGPNGGLVPAPSAELEEPYVIRPTSETIIGDAMARWVQSYRDLPLKLNQWGNVMRWEMRTRLFLRTSEFFWHEGHCAFETPKEARDDALHVMGLYKKFFEEYLAFTGYAGPKTAEERFPGAIETIGFEAMMQDGKALQAATTHDLGQNFSKSIGIKFQGRDGKEAFAHTTSWAYSTRTLGGMIMMHGDDDGMIMPPRVAPTQIIILPVIKDEAGAGALNEFCDKILSALKKAGFAAKVDGRDMRTPDKMWEAVKKGIPVRVEVGQREMEANSVTFVRRDLGKESKTTWTVDEFMAKIQGVLDAIHDNLLSRNRKFLADNTADISTVAGVREFYAADKIGFVRIPVELLQDPELDKVRDEFKLSTRCMPFEDEGRKVLLAKSY
ncbi:MAG: proline--tRNA ligase [Micavibrio aeruginosavorus]|uniref:Proline--tRNA ligase n=1 Tax=Micavibrio aeruginosavorus TaxID=349221 RepID=A0A2W5BYA5_9BACT|nr:MAG: proline--tRNA ligase [Micavibrio aeruginosavorus]